MCDEAISTWLDTLIL